MEKIEITSTTDRVDIIFNSYSDVVGMPNGSWGRRHIISVRNKVTYIEISILGEKEWQVSFDGSGETFQIDSIDGSTPTSNSDLHTRLKVLIK